VTTAVELEFLHLTVLRLGIRNRHVFDLANGVIESVRELRAAPAQK
jgi:hypothetical protein